MLLLDIGQKSLKFYTDYGWISVFVDITSIQEKYKNIPRGLRVSLVSFLIAMTKCLIQATRKGGGREGRKKEGRESGKV